MAAVNNEGELPMDLCISQETDDVADMLQREINIRGESPLTGASDWSERRLSESHSSEPFCASVTSAKICDLSDYGGV